LGIIDTPSSSSDTAKYPIGQDLAATTYTGEQYSIFSVGCSTIIIINYSILLKSINHTINNIVLVKNDISN
jgi:hypothetical protein